MEGAGEVAVASAEAGGDGGEGGGHLFAVETHDAFDHAGCPPFVLAGEGVAGYEQLGDHAGGVWRQPKRVAPREPVRHQTTVGCSSRACCSVTIRASVDSVPWLRLGPVTWRPS